MRCRQCDARRKTAARRCRPSAGADDVSSAPAMFGDLLVPLVRLHAKRRSVHFSPIVTSTVRKGVVSARRTRAGDRASRPRADQSGAGRGPDQRAFLAKAVRAVMQVLHQIERHISDNTHDDDRGKHSDARYAIRDLLWSEVLRRWGAPAGQ